MFRSTLFRWTEVFMFKHPLIRGGYGTASHRIAWHEARPSKFRLVILHDTHDTTYETEMAVKRDGTFLCPMSIFSGIQVSHICCSYACYVRCSASPLSAGISRLYILVRATMRANWSLNKIGLILKSVLPRMIWSEGSTTSTSTRKMRT